VDANRVVNWTILRDAMLCIAPQDEVEALCGAPQNEEVGYLQEPNPLVLNSRTRGLVDKPP